MFVSAGQDSRAANSSNKNNKIQQIGQEIVVLHCHNGGLCLNCICMLYSIVYV